MFSESTCYISVLWIFIGNEWIWEVFQHILWNNTKSIYMGSLLNIELTAPISYKSTGILFLFHSDESTHCEYFSVRGPALPSKTYM